MDSCSSSSPRRSRKRRCRGGATRTCCAKCCGAWASASASRRDDELLGAFAASPGDWQPFPDTVDALARLAERMDLVIVSNIDNALFRRTAGKLGARFKHVVTAEDVGVYKPDARMFDAALAALGRDTRVLHVAQSLYHDIAPATAKGLDTAWIRRDANAAKRIAAKPTWTFDSLAEFADALLEP